MGFDLNAASGFLQGFLTEQERIKNEKKINTLLKDKNYDVQAEANPQTGQIIYQLKPKEQIRPGFVPSRQTVGGTTFVNPEAQRKINSIKVIGNSLVKYNEDGTATPIYTAPPGIEFRTDKVGNTHAINKATGEVNMIMDFMGNPVEPPKIEEPKVEQKLPVSNPSSGGRVKVKDKSGKTFTVPSEQLELAISKGYTQVK